MTERMVEIARTLFRKGWDTLAISEYFVKNDYPFTEADIYNALSALSKDVREAA